MKVKVAFVCVHNSCRSQMAEAIARLIAPDTIEVYSAGTELKPEINPQAIETIRELYGVDISKTRKPKHVSELPPIDILITMGCGVECPFLPCKHREDWGIEDPTGKSKEEFVKTALQIEEKVRSLIERLPEILR